MRARISYLALALVPLGTLAAVDAPDFAGTWTLDSARSNIRALPAPPGPLLTISRQGVTYQCVDSDVTWSFRLDDTETENRIKDSVMHSQAKWEGAALLIDTTAAGPPDYAVHDRWQLSNNGAELTITRTIEHRGTTTVSTLIYSNRERLDALAKAAADVIVKAGTKIPLSLVNPLDTKRSKAGDRVYLETAFPIVQDSKIIIPKGSYVVGTVTEARQAGKMKGRAELYVRFDSLTLPNGVTRDFRSRPDTAGGRDVDRKEGKIVGDSDVAGDVRKVGEAAGAGTSVGGIAGSAAGHGIMGAGIGALAGAATGLAVVLLTRGPEVVLPKGTTLEMVLDRELRYSPRELAAATQP